MCFWCCCVLLLLLSIRFKINCIQISNIKSNIAMKINIYWENNRRKKNIEIAAWGNRRYFNICISIWWNKKRLFNPRFFCFFSFLLLLLLFDCYSNSLIYCDNIIFLSSKTRKRERKQQTLLFLFYFCRYFFLSVVGHYFSLFKNIQYWIVFFCFLVNWMRFIHAFKIIKNDFICVAIVGFVITKPYWLEHLLLLLWNIMIRMQSKYEPSHHQHILLA